MKKSIRGRLADNAPNPVDEHVGKRIRLRRNILGITQQEFAAKLSITFQQVQKYEKAINRISASRLWDVAQILHTSVNYFFDDMDGTTAHLSPRNIDNNEDIISTIDDPMLKEETLKLVLAYYKIKNRAAAKHIMDAIQEFAK